jgi:hypothetical protein
MKQRAGLLVRAGEALSFLPAETAESVVPLPTLSPVANTPLQMALVNGRVVTVLALGSPTGVLVLCSIEEETLGISGLEVEVAGAFDAAERGVLIDGRHVPELELGHLLRSLEPAFELTLAEAT